MLGPGRRIGRGAGRRDGIAQHRLRQPGTHVAFAADAGRPITDLASDLDYPELADDAREVLQKLAAVEKPISARDGRWFTVRIMPYRTLDDRIDGVVITFANITVAKKLEGRLRGRHTALEKCVAEDFAERAASEAAGGKRTRAAGKARRTRKQ